MPWIELWRPTRISVDAWLANADRLAVAAAGQMRHEGLVRATGMVFEPEAREVVRALQNIERAQDLDDPVRRRLALIVKECTGRLGGLTLPEDVMIFAMQLAHARGLLDHAHAGSEALRRSRVERAFEHLNRSLIVDRDLRERWRRAFAEGEVECEKRGAVHLLLHGVFAFKANDTGGRTDLVLGGELEVTPAVMGSEALALTEWKLVRHDKNTADRARAAREQARLYKKGVLAGVEVAHTRFIVLVSMQHLPDEPDVWEPNHEGAQVLYRHVNVVIDPPTPSKAATKSLSKKASARARRRPRPRSGPGGGAAR